MSARVSSQQNTDPWAKAGVMLRASTDPGAPYYFVMITPGNGVNVQYRDGQGNSAQWPAPSIADTTPVYLRADRVGTTFSAYSSHDAVNWTLIPGSVVTIASLSGDILAGPAVTAHNAGATSAATFDFVRVDACPDGWGCADITPSTVPGSQYADSDGWLVQSAGGDIGGIADRFRYVWRRIAGDGSITARLTSQTDTATQAKAGLMYRAGNDPGAPYFLVALTANNGVVVLDRTTTGGGSATLATLAAAALPLYLRVTRTGNAFTASVSPDGALWQDLASATIGGFPTSAELGLAVASADGSATSTATFDTLDTTGAPDPAPAPGTDLATLDTNTAHYTQGSNGQVDVQLYNSPAGVVGPGGWAAGDTTLSPLTATSALAPARVSYSAQVASSSAGAGLTPTASGPTLAALTSEDGVTLSVGLAAAPTPQASGQIHSNTVTYSGAAESSGGSPTTSDLSVRTTASGLDARVVLHSASETGPFVLTLGTDPAETVAQDPGGVIRVTQPVTGYGDDGVSTDVVTQTEYTVQQPLLDDSSTASTAAVATGPATATLTTGTGGPAVSLSVDPAWLTNPNRVFPATLDLPIVTAAASADTRFFGTVNSCAPTAPAVQTRVVVGTLTGCAYHGQAYFDLAQLPADATIVSATLRLYTPAQTTATGVQVAPNAAVAADDPYGDPATDPSAQPPSWASAPLIMTGTTPLAQTGSDGHWQSWDVTGIVSGWLTAGTPNDGFTLTGTGTPVAFASPLGAESDAPAVAPYLDIVYAPAASPPRAFDDTAHGLYGVSGSYAVDAPPAPSVDRNCSRQSACHGNIFPKTVSHPLSGRLLRMSVNIPCSDATNNAGWWNTQGSVTINGQTLGQADRGDSNNSTTSVIAQLLADAYRNNLVPIVTFQMDDQSLSSPQNPNSCDDYLGYKTFSSNDKTVNPNMGAHWQQAMQAFASTVLPEIQTYLTPSHLNLTDKYTYFEIGNEQNVHDPEYYGQLYPDGNNRMTNNYPPLFAAAAQGLNVALQGKVKGYRIMPSGPIEPTAATVAQCTDSKTTPAYLPGIYNYRIAAQALAQANGPHGSGVSYDHLGVAVHPYNYSTPNPDNSGRFGYWRNFYSEYGDAYNGTIYHNRYPGVCRDLGRMLQLWTAPYRGPDGTTHRLPLVFTEDNWSDHPEVTPSRPQPNGTHKLNGTQACSNVDGCEGTYLVDLFTWLDDHRQLYHTDLDAASSPLRVAWYHGADKNEPAVFAHIGQGGLGLYKGEGVQKPFHITFCADRYDPNLADKPPTNQPASVVSTQFQQRQRVPCY